MRTAILGSVAGLLFGAGLVLAQPYPQPMPSGPAPETAPRPTPLAGPAPAPTLPGGPGPGGGFPGPVQTAPPDQWYAQAKLEYLLWWLQSPHFIGPITATDILSVPGSRPLFGSRRIAFGSNPNSGARLTLGYFLSDVHNDALLAPAFRYGFEANYFDMGRQSLNTRHDSAPVIFRPFFDLNNRRESALVVGAPGIVTGGFEGITTFDFMGAEANALLNCFYNYPRSVARIDLLAGFRYFQLNEDFQFKSVSTYSNPQPLGSPFGFLAGDTLQVNDLFATRNRFLGPQVGAIFKFLLGDFDFMVGSKVALGWNDSEIHIEGNQVRTGRGGRRDVFTGGLLAQRTNIGRFEQTMFAWMPELNVGVNAHVTEWCTITFGYTFLYLNRAFRPGQQIDRVIDITQIPNFPDGGATPTGLRRPMVPFRETDVWVQGMNIGLQLTW